MLSDENEYGCSRSCEKALVGTEVENREVNRCLALQGLGSHGKKFEFYSN